MKIMRMSLDNFKGIRRADFSFDGCDANIYGANGTGKTTIFDAFTWLLFGKGSEEESDFTPKTIEGDDFAHNLDHSVECDIEIDGEVTTFKRVYREVWTKKRGNATAELSGHTTDYYINGSPKKEKEYARFWENIFPDDDNDGIVVKLLTMPYYFPKDLHWEKRRGILLDICGTISDAAIMEKDADLAALAGLIGKLSVDEFRKTVKASLADINRKIQLLPARIDEANRAIPDVTGLSESELDDGLSVVRNNIQDAEKDRAALLSGGDNAAKTREAIANLNTELAEARGKHIEEQQAVSSSLDRSVQDAKGKVSNAERDLSDNRRNLEDAKRKVASIEKTREEIFAAHRKAQEAHNRLQAEVFGEDATVCDKCGQPLPADKVSVLRDTFNECKSNELTALTCEMAALVERGTREASKEMLAEAQGYVKTLEALIEGNEGLIIILDGKVSEAEADKRNKALPPFEQTAAYADINGRIAAAKEAEQSSAPDTSEIDAKISGYRQEESTILAKKSALETEKTQRARIADLEAEEKKLGADYEKAERALYLCEKFTRAKSALLNSKINERFRTVSFRLFKQNITNDGIDDICEVLVPGKNGTMVPFKKANKAAKLNAALEIIDILGEHYGVELPIFVDNAESVTDIIPTRAQLIRLVVSKEDEVLRLETL